MFADRDMWGSSKTSRVAGYRDLDTDHLVPEPPRSRGSQQLVTVVVSVLCVSCLLGLVTLARRQDTVLVILDTEAKLEDEATTPRLALEVTSSGGWGVGQLGHPPPPDTPDPKWDPEPSPSKLGLFDYAAVSVDSIPCAKIGK